MSRKFVRLFCFKDTAKNNFPELIQQIGDNTSLYPAKDWKPVIGYEQTIEVKMQRLFTTLSEKDKRRYAGIEATKLGNGGIDYISKLFAIDPKTIRPECVNDFETPSWFI